MIWEIAAYLAMAAQYIVAGICFLAVIFLIKQLFSSKD